MCRIVFIILLCVVNFSVSTAIADPICSANVPNPNPLPNETAEFYGDCTDGKPISGIVIWKQSGVPFKLSCMQNGEYKLFVDTCSKYYPLIPNYCNSGDYDGQCLNGVPHGVGVKSWKTNGILTDYMQLNGQWDNVADGYSEFYYRKRCGAFGCTGGSGGYESWNEKGVEKVRCEGGAEACRKKAVEAAERERVAAIEKKNEEIRQQEAKKKEEASRQEAEKLLKKQLASKKPKEIYIAAGKYEANEDYTRAVLLYNAIIDRFPEHDLAIKSTDRLTRIKDREAAKKQSAAAGKRADELQRGSEREERSRHNAMCESNSASCKAQCESLKNYNDTSKWFSCQYQCDKGYEACVR